MDSKYPKRRKDKYNPYTIHKNNEKYFVSFEDGQNILHTVEISKELYEQMDKMELEDLSYLNEMDRHFERKELSEEDLEFRMRENDESVIDKVIKRNDAKILQEALKVLTESQKRRIVMHFFVKLSYKQIGDYEGCSYQAIQNSIEKSLKKLKKFLKKGL